MNAHTTTAALDEARRNHLQRTAAALVRGAETGAITKGKPVRVYRAEIVRGARAGAVKLYAGLETGTLMRSLAAEDAAVARQFLSWPFVGSVQVYIDDRAVRIEAGWPDELANRDIRLSRINNRPKGGGRWIAGIADGYSTVTLGLNDQTPHFLIAGFTGSGKTEAIRSAVVQYSRDTANEIVLIDGKQGDGLHPLSHLPGVVAPLAVDIVDVRRALAWSVQQMRERYERKNRGATLSDRLIVVADEIQAFASEKAGDAAVSALLQQLVTQGRGARVHVVLGTQHPVTAAFSDPLVRRNLVGRIALRTEDYKASEVVVGGEYPRADKLLGQGDAFAIVPGHVERVQMAWIPEHEFGSLPHGQYRFDEWPEIEPEDVGSFDGQFEPQEVAMALMAANRGDGRPKLQAAIERAGLPRPGSGRADRLLRYGRAIMEHLKDLPGEDWPA